ncbi:unnamed protein product [Urochloa decumbens]|uniref:Uncharacterized protein n=1 Tax=Urochloa decumbens TaxID=240449 RepID=A0ABC9D258_9POAL
MSYGRESPSAADAVARWLALVLALVSTTLPRGAPSQERLAPPPLPQPRLDTTTCHNVPYPFGFRGASLPGFEVRCGPNNEAMLPIGDQAYRIDSVSAPGGYVVIFAGPVEQVCYDREGKPTAPATGTGPTSLDGTPFTFSKSNSLVNIGCNSMLSVAFSKRPGDPSRPAAVCATWCPGVSDATVSGSCLGEACCKIGIPEDYGVEAFTLSFDRTPGEDATAEEYGTCSTAFFLHKDEQVFTLNGSEEEAKLLPLKEALSPPAGERRMILDWAIGSATCDQAQSYSFAPLCNVNSTCVDAPRGSGYLCICPQGYDGNPYTDGCDRDIDECRDYHTNNCTYPNYCNNTQGGYTCSCPANDIGDGYKTGTGCNSTSGTSLCSHPENNPCTYPNYCIDLQGAALCSCPEGMNGDGRKKGSGCQKHFPLDTVLGVGLALMVTMTTAASCYCWAIKKRELGRRRAEFFRKNGGLLMQQRFSTITSQEEGQSAKIFSAEELKGATNNYSESGILGRGGHGTVYKGILPDRTIVAIKKSKVFDESQVEQFVNEIAILSQIDHPNVVKLLGCCLETRVPLLVYEYIPNGTLCQHIHNRNASCTLTWEDCLRMAAEIAEALAYLHSTSSTPIVHRDIKSSNILLDENFVAKIADFGASRSVPFDKTHITTLIQGTIGYLDPEYFQSGQLTEKSDVYSFGVILAELLTRQKPISAARPEESCNLAMHLVVLFNGGRLLQEIQPHILAEAGEEQFYAVAELSVRCLNMKGEDRPIMKDVALVLDGLRRSFTMEQTTRRKHDSVQQNIEEQEHILHETKVPDQFLHCSH